MELSARNQLPETVKSVSLGGIMAEVVVDVAGHEVVAAITRSSAERLNLQAGAPSPAAHLIVRYNARAHPCL
jgi:molybdopterin-binding protein